MEIVKKELAQEPAPEKKKQQILVELDEGDSAMLRAFTEYSSKAKVQVLRECLRHCYRAQFGGGS
jgi:hypothetical protein